MKTVMSVAALAAAASGRVIENQYIVQLKSSHIKSNVGVFKHLESHGITADNLLNEYNINNGQFIGYAFKGDANQMLSLSEDPAVMFIEPNQEVHALCEENEEVGGLYGLNRVTNFRGDNTQVSRIESSWGEGVRAYILDTGVLYSHEQFPNVDTNCNSQIAGENCGEDGNGHGTHVAGSVSGATFGVARAATLVDVKVLSRSGSGSFAGVIGGVNWTAEDCASRKCTANMSLGGGASTAVNQAVQAAADAGVSMVVASGNSNRDACTFSPAGAGGKNSDNVITVNSSDNRNIRSSFSNFGDCTDVFAPGSNILSAWIGSNTATRTISGTSMASPHVCGVVTAMLSEGDYTPTGLKSQLISDSIPDAISNVGTGSPNRLAQVTC